MILEYEYIVKVRKVCKVEISDDVIEKAVMECLKTGKIKTADEFFASPDIFTEHIDVYDYEMEVVEEEEQYNSITGDEDVCISIPHEELSFDEFEERYSTIENPYQDESYMFSYDEDDAEDLYIETRAENYVWSIIEDDDGRTIVPGKRIVNRVGYYVTEKPWWNKYIVVNDAE